MYISSANQTVLSARYRLTALIVAALGISTVLYVVIGWAFAPAMPRVSYQWLTNSHYVIVGLVAVIALVVVFLRRFYLSPARLYKAGQKGINTLLSQLYLCSLIGAVLGDVVGILGVVASLVTSNREYSWRLGLAALLMIAYSFPRRNEWSRAVAGMELEKNNSAGVTTAAEQIKLGLSELQ
ncbi:MAG: hypothetical protein JNM09_01170 [Blastocatellia bacterium]|nr:hypothetical protein [Blastocatellia bacterium]